MNENSYASAYSKAEAYIYDIPKFTKKHDLKNTEKLMSLLNNPSMDKKVIHVAGTNGKGSVCAYLNGFLLENQKKVGMFTSPHLISMTERIRVNGYEITKEKFADAYKIVLNAVNDAVKMEAGIEHPTFFEFLFLLAMVAFSKEDVEYIILETGLGGKLDSTNVIKEPLLTIITRIGLDHCKYLGNTKSEIAAQKAGIIKTGIPVVSIGQEREVVNVIESCAKKLGSMYYKVDKDDYYVENFNNKNIDFSYESRYYGYISFTVPTRALYQVENIILAMKGFEIISDSSECLPITIQSAISKVRWEGRMDEISDGIFLDGAHNEDGMRAFLDSVSHMKCRGKKYLCFSAMEDKDIDAMLKLISESKLFDYFAAAPLDDARGLSYDNIKQKIKLFNIDNTILFDNVEQAFLFCKDNKSEEDIVYAVGSLYLVGQIKAVLGRNKG